MHIIGSAHDSNIGKSVSCLMLFALPKQLLPFSRFQNPSPRRHSQRQHVPRHRHRAVELLEPRQLLAATLWVDPASTAPGDFHTIQAAVNAATSGDTIKVAPGTYAESVTISKPLTILAHQIHLPGESGSSTVKSDTAAFTVSGTNAVTIEGFDINPLTPGNNNFDVGIEVTNTADSKIQGNAINDVVGFAIFLAGGVTGTLVQDNVATVPSALGVDGIQIASGVSSAANTDDRISINQVTGYNEGIYLSSPGNVLLHNTVEKSAADGILLLSTGETVQDNVAENNKAGITELSTGAATLQDNRAEFNTGAGITSDPTTRRP
jgi:parallel beta-helix repeat protein